MEKKEKTDKIFPLNKLWSLNIFFPQPFFLEQQNQAMFWLYFIGMLSFPSCLEEDNVKSPRELKCEMYVKLVHSTNLQRKTWQYRYLFFFFPLEKEAERVKEDLGPMVGSVYMATSQWCEVSMWLSFLCCPSVSYWTVCLCLFFMSVLLFKALPFSLHL